MSTRKILKARAWSMFLGNSIGLTMRQCIAIACRNYREAL